MTAPSSSGRGPARPIIDSHTHAFPDKLAATAIPRLEAESLWFPVRAAFDGTIAGLLGSMDRAGIRRAIMCSVATKPEQVAKITDWSARVAADRIIPFPSIHPDYPDPEAEVERIAALGLKGLKFHPYYMNCPIDDPRSVRIARAAAGAGLAMLFHAGYDISYEKTDIACPRRIRRLHEAVPGLRMAAAHLGAWEDWPEVLAHLAGLPIYMETSFTIGRCPEDLLMKILAAHPPDYLMFGTDAPWTDQVEEVKKFLALPISEDLKRGMLWDNAQRFAGLDDK